MSRQQETHDRRPLWFWILVTGLVVLLLAAGVWQIVARFAAEGDGYVEPVTVAEKEADIDQSQAVPPERSDGQDDLESFRKDTDAESEPAVSPERSDGQDDLESSRKDTDAESDLTAAQTPPQADLGLEDIVREFTLEFWGGETLRAEDDYVPSIYAKLDSTDFETRRRGEFELAVHVHFVSIQADDPYYPLLQKLRDDSWWSCLEEYGVPPLEEFGPLTPEQQDALMEELGLVGERMEQVVDDCWSRARIYAGKDEETDRLLELQHQYYLTAAQDWVQENPDSVVPLPLRG